MNTDPTAATNSEALTWLASLTVFEWLGIVAAVVITIIILCKIFGCEIIEGILELLGALFCIFSN